MNKKILFISLHRPERSPSQRFRFEQYIEFLSSNGFDCKHQYHLNEDWDKVYYGNGKLISKFVIVVNTALTLLKALWFGKYDIIFVQREAFMLGTAFFERQFSKKSKLVFDFDDSIWMNQTGELKSGNRKLYFLKNPQKTLKIIEASHMVFAGNTYLAQYANQHNKNVVVIPTTINTKEYTVIKKPDKKKVCIGWSGSFSTIIHLEYVRRSLKKIKARYEESIFFKVIGDGSYKSEELEVQGIPWSKESEIKDLSEIDIGIMPLPDDQWTKGKCGLKGLQYMALGIPCIMSPVGVNKEIIIDGKNGFLAYSDSEWIDKISLLIENQELRINMGLEGRKTVENRFSINATKELYLKHLNSLI